MTDISVSGEFLTPHLRNLKSVALSPKRSRDPDHDLFGGIFTLGVGLAVVDPLAKFNEHSRNT